MRKYASQSLVTHLVRNQEVPRGADLKMPSAILTLRDHRDDVNGCALSATLLATCSGDKTIRVYSLGDFSELPFSPLSGHGYGVHWCCFSSCGNYLASCSTDATVVIWSMDTGEIIFKYEHPGRSPVRVCALSPDSSLVLSCASDGTVALWDFQSTSLRRTGEVTEATVLACSFTPCGQMFVTGCTSGDLKIWDLDLVQLHAQKVAHDLGVSCCQCDSIAHVDGETVKFRLVSCGQDSLLKIWIISQHAVAGCRMQLLHSLKAQSGPVLSCAFSSDGQLVASGSVDKTLAVYDAIQGVLLHTLNQHERYVTSCAFSPSLPYLASGSMDKTVIVWRLGDGDESGRHDAEAAAAVCPGRKRAAMGHSRLLVRDWTEEHVGAWLAEEGMDELVSAFKSHNIDGPELLSLTKDTLAKELHIGSLGLRGKVLRKIEELRPSLDGSAAPDEFLCPITQEVLKDPVIAADGFSYEREAIERWIGTKNRTSPMTNLPLPTTMLTPNRMLKMAINRWRASQ
ncbi:WD repeat, SAM and U-box domain-containing protein 1-like [Alosa pseudoharengus]|uniref:WD repeat, SAM and U-box domain-containing protein 1-like n=1 Tax=Alosa pseudoharengus TaxID=34774 RepID=UPI003F8B8425